MAQQTSNLNESLARIKDSGDYSDLTIVCGKSEFKVHRAIVCPQSGFFSAACKEGFKETSTGTIELQEEDEELVRLMVEYLYTTMYTDEYDGLTERLPCNHPEDTDCSCDDKRCYLRSYGIAISLYAMGDKYLIPGLMTYSSAYIKKMFIEAGPRYLNHDIKVWALAYRHSRKSDELRAVVLKTVCDELSNTEIVDYSGFLEFLEEVPELTCALLKITLRWYSEHWEKCTEDPFKLEQDVEL
ncbi:multicopper oxidase abr1 [Physcia stellaris]|nr:multicopper oxidase abr1 [Physcia stellaris]